MRSQILSPSGSRPVNLAINGAMDIWQRIAGNSLNLAAATQPLYSADRMMHITVGPTTKSFTAQRSTNVPSSALVGITPAYSLQTTCNTTVASLAAADRWFALRYTVEDKDMVEAVQLGFLTVSFEFFATTAGTYPWRSYNFAANRSYVSTFSYTTPNVWQQIVIQIPLESGSYNFGFYIEQSGSTFQTGTLNTWIAGDISTPSSGIVNLYTSGLTMRLTNLSVFAGKVYPQRNNFYRRAESFTNELILCQRYFEKSWSLETAVGTATSVGEEGFWPPVAFSNAPLPGTVKFKVRKRAAPVFVPYSPSSGFSDRIRNQSTGTDYIVASHNTSEVGCTPNFGPGASATAGHLVVFQWTADAEI